MSGRRVTALVGAGLGLVVITGCSSGDEPTTGSTPSDAGVSAPTPDESTAETPDTELPSLEIPTDIPTDLPTDLSGLGLDESCEEIYEALLEATTATEDLATDPGAAGELFAGISESLRDAADDSGDEIQAAAEALATVYDDFAAALAAGETPDIERLTSAATELQDACTA